MFEWKAHIASGPFRNLSIICLSLSLATSCGHVISSEMREKARSGLSISQVHQNPDAFMGKTVIWGGVIVETVSTQEATVLLVAETPLGSYERPRDQKHSRGKFLARSKYLDTEVYEKGRKITLAGEIIGKEVQLSGKSQYTYPLVSIKEIHLWSILEHGGDRPIDWDSYPSEFYDWGR